MLTTIKVNPWLYNFLINFIAKAPYNKPNAMLVNSLPGIVTKYMALVFASTFGARDDDARKIYRGFRALLSLRAHAVGAAI